MAGDIGTAYVQIVPSAKGISGSISKTLNGEAEQAGASAGNSIAGKIKSVIKTAAIGKALVDTIKEGARYEQAVGGIETLFKGASDRMIKYANNAWKTAGVSANQYMEQSTSFAASLLQSLGGDVEKAATAANKAVIDMADNANKMGTPLESIQMAYQGFAKQQYMLLDNLKLGYGGTKTEMERLLADAEKLTGVKYDINNLSDVYSAIHVIQEELGITGTTALEASTTLSGSFASMQAAFSNFMAQLTTGGNVSKAMSDLGNSIITFASNLIPAVVNVLSGLPEALYSMLSTAIPNALDRLAALAQDILSGKGTELGTNFGTTLGEKVLPALIKLLPKIPQAFMGILTALVSAAANLGAGFVKGLWNKVKDIKSTVVDKISNWFKNMKLSLPKIKLPHFKVTGKLSLNPPSVPHLSIDWYKTGGIFNEPTIAGIGEAGSEAVVPLNELWNRFDAMANAIVSGVAESVASDSGRVVQFQIIGDPHGMFKVVQREANNYMQATSQPAFNL